MGFASSWRQIEIGRPRLNKYLPSHPARDAVSTRQLLQALLPFGSGFQGSCWLYHFSRCGSSLRRFCGGSKLSKTWSFTHRFGSAFFNAAQAQLA